MVLPGPPECHDSAFLLKLLDYFSVNLFMINIYSEVTHGSVHFLLLSMHVPACWCQEQFRPLFIVCRLLFLFPRSSWLYWSILGELVHGVIHGSILYQHSACSTLERVYVVERSACGSYSTGCAWQYMVGLSKISAQWKWLAVSKSHPGSEKCADQ